MINNADVNERLCHLIGKELTSVNLHEALFCEAKHKKIRCRFELGKHIYVQFKIMGQGPFDAPSFADISISGNPNTFRVGIEVKDGRIIIINAPRVSYTYI